MWLSALNSTAPYRRMIDPTLPPSSINMSVIEVTKFSFYLLGVSGFLVLMISGLVIVRTQFALEAFADKDGPLPTISVDRKPRIHTKTEPFSQRDQAVTAVIRRARSFALFGPLPSLLSMVAVPVSLHLDSVGDGGFRVLFSALLISIIHCANACYVQTYFGLIAKKTRVSFGAGVCSAREEKIRSGRVMRIYLTVLFALSFVRTDAKDERADM